MSIPTRKGSKVSDAIARAQQERSEELNRFNRSCQALLSVIHEDRGISIEAARIRVAASENLYESDVQGALWHLVKTAQIQVATHGTLYRPYHNPLHPNAVALNDLEPGLKVNLYYRRHGVWEVVETLVIASEPFPENTDSLHTERLEVMVVRIDSRGKRTLESRYLDELGIVPHEGYRNQWIEDCFTLVVR